MAGISQHLGGNNRKWSVDGLGPLLVKLQGEPIYARPWRRALLEALRAGKALATQRAPRGASGKLAARNTMRMQRIPVPLWGVVSNKATKKGFRYGFALDAGRATRKKSGRTYTYHRLGSGSPTKGWFTGVLARIQPRVNALLTAAAKDIEAAWK